jgi:hypothetical protein
MLTSFIIIKALYLENKVAFSAVSWLELEGFFSETSYLAHDRHELQGMSFWLRLVDISGNFT